MMQMNLPRSSMLYSITTSIFFMLAMFPENYCAGVDQNYTICSQLYNCGTIQGLTYPFWGKDRPENCGRKDFKLDCINNRSSVIQIIGMQYFVLKVDKSNSTMRLARSDLWNDLCGFQGHGPNETSINPLSSTIYYSKMEPQLQILYGCAANSVPQLPGMVLQVANVSCLTNGVKSGVFFEDVLWSTSSAYVCNTSITIPVLPTAYTQLWDRNITLIEALKQGFDASYDTDSLDCSACEASGGRCGSNSYQSICLCPDQPYLKVCPAPGKKLFMRVILGVGGVGLMICLLICFSKFVNPSDVSILLLKRKTKDDQHLEAFIRKHGPLAPKRYRYSDIKKMTNSFKDKLGQGGYGSVYKGQLQDGRPVAVKILDLVKGNGEEFINEVLSISKTSHINIVTLLGFCLDAKKRALVYQYMPNGSLEKYIHREETSESSGQLGFDRRYQISLGVARGLEYLHRGCNMQILHFDIKPHNILLDEDFCPKISDFGLAKLSTRKESIICMLEARGTIGYIAPEVISRNFGAVSHKSDVYSYGMMLLEMVGGRKNVSVGVSHTSEIYFPHWVYQRIVLDEDLKLQSITTPEEDEIARKMILVGLWCIQNDPTYRPAVSRVIEMLESSLEALEIPPKPFFGSPPRLSQCSSTTIVVK